MSTALMPSGVQLWQVPQHGQDVAAQTSLLSPQELSHLNALTDAATRDRHVLARAALRVALSRWMPAVAPQDWRFTRSAHGRPELAGSLDATSLSFNVAHTDDEIIVALSADGRVGVDVEALQRQADALALARRYFQPEEVAVLEALSVHQRQQRFLELWTLKEACVKATGEGLARGLRRVGFTLDAASGIVPLSMAHEGDDAWQFWQWSLAGRHLVALALQGGSKPCVVRWGRLQNLQPVEMDAPHLLRASAAYQARMYSSTNLEP